jgi:hypothetical protein
VGEDRWREERGEMEDREREEEGEGEREWDRIPVQATAKNKTR